ncbi:MAG: ATP synthase F1 subunit delta [Bacteroidales bacterium]|jgi:F-type H+-transporting ATPase subunit delta|nr:ATP synthase F1 subunit delta [Bacteroidales bacterium]
MNTGIISSRYATALLRYTQETGGGERVCAQVRRLLDHPEQDPGPLEPELERLIRLLVQNGRMEDVRLILRSFLTKYYQSLGVKVAVLTTVVASEELEHKVRAMLEKQFGGEVLIESRVDPALVGGFTLEVGDYLLDASVRRQIETIRRQFVIQNNRIV